MNPVGVEFLSASFWIALSTALRGVFEARTTRQNKKAFNPGFSSHSPQTHFALYPIRDSRCFRLNAKRFSNRRQAQVGVDQQNPQTLVRQRYRVIGGTKRFSFVWCGTRQKESG